MKVEDLTLFTYEYNSNEFIRGSLTDVQFLPLLAAEPSDRKATAGSHHGSQSWLL